MNLFLATGMSCVLGVLASCTERRYQGSESSDVNDRPSSQVNSQAFNAFNIWRDGKGIEISDYPRNFQSTTGVVNSDGVFFFAEGMFWKKGDDGVRNFIAVPTEGAKVEGDVLIYPPRSGKQLKLKFSPMNQDTASHGEAVQKCKDKNMRLPTVRELFDFCAAGVTEPKFGPNFKSGAYPKSARCGGNRFWSASVDSDARDYAWLFDGVYGYVTINYRDIIGFGVRCVEAP
jgi:hypothetical protein